MKNFATKAFKNLLYIMKKISITIFNNLYIIVSNYQHKSL